LRAVVLLSGGLDSSTTLAVARSRGYETLCLTMIYGQKHDREVDSARDVARSMGAIEHRIVELPTEMFSGSSLTGKGEVPDGPTDGIPNTYVPARNLVFLSLAVAWAEFSGAQAVFIGVTSVDYSGYPDCRPEFIRSFEIAANLATREGTEGDGIRIEAPLLYLDKASIVNLGKELGLDHSLTWSCYKGGEKACGRCDSCRLRLKGFEEAGLVDPLEYEV